MDYYYARFESIKGHYFRFDTRIYLNERVANKQDICVGAIIGKNPGSAMPKAKLGSLSPLELSGDKMLPYVRNRFINSYKAAVIEIPQNAYIRVWNLFYLCDPDLYTACQIARSFGENLPSDEAENQYSDIVWFAYGGQDDFLDPFKKRFLKNKYKRPFFYDWRNKHLSLNQPINASCFAKHTQGLNAQIIENHISTLLAT